MNGIPHYLLLTTVVAAILGRKRAWLALPLSVLLWIPLQPHLIGIIRGALGELSVGSMVLIVLLLLRTFRGVKISSLPGIKPTATIIAVAGFILYGNFLGLLPLGGLVPYELAFTSPVTVVVFCLFAAVAVWYGWLWPALWVILSVAVWILDLHPSRNPWDCQLAPVLVITCFVVTIRHLISRRHAS